MATLNSLPPFTEYTIQLSVRNAVELEGEAAVIRGMTDSFSKTHGFITTCSLTKYGSTSYTSTGMTDSFCFAVESTQKSCVQLSCLFLAPLMLMFSTFAYRPALFPIDLDQVMNLMATAVNSTAIMVTWMVSRVPVDRYWQCEKEWKKEH